MFFPLYISQVQLNELIYQLIPCSIHMCELTSKTFLSLFKSPQKTLPSLFNPSVTLESSLSARARNITITPLLLK